MIDWDLYEGREQSGVKHFFLENYLERVAYNIGSFHDRFDYVDGFTGPWESEGLEFQDTSFMIAINTLRKVREGWAKRGRTLNIRCIFVEKQKSSFERLQSALSGVSDIKTELIRGEFETAIPSISQLVGRSFAFTFIDPKGWSGFALETISPLLQTSHGEVMINFMFDHINRFFEDDRPEIVGSLDRLFGGAGWKSMYDHLISNGVAREDAILGVYRQRLKEFGGYKFATSTRVLNPKKDRSHYHLVYGTNHEKGLMEFRSVEKKLYTVQANVRARSKEKEIEKLSGQASLPLFADQDAKSPIMEDQRQKHLDWAASRFKKRMSTTKRRSYENVLGELLEYPLVWESDVKEMIAKEKSAGNVWIDGLSERQKVPSYGKGHFIVRKTNED